MTNFLIATIFAITLLNIGVILANQETKPVCKADVCSTNFKCVDGKMVQVK
jgi:hypothetical protein